MVKLLNLFVELSKILVEINRNLKENKNEGSFDFSPLCLSTKRFDDSTTFKKRGNYKKRAPSWDHYDEDHINGIQHEVCKYYKKKIPGNLGLMVLLS